MLNDLQVREDKDIFFNLKPFIEFAFDFNVFEGRVFGEDFKDNEGDLEDVGVFF